MGHDIVPDGDRSGRLDAAMAEYLASIDAGTPLDADSWLACHPDLASDLAVFLDDYDHLGRFVAPYRTSATETTRVTPVPAGMPDRTDVWRPGSADEGRDPRGAEIGSYLRYMGDFELIEVLGRGGMGVVYLARQLSLDRHVALKMIRDGHLAGADDLRMFRREAKAVARLDHPNLLAIYEVGEHEGHHYFTMPLVGGGSLADHLPRYRDEPRLAVGVMIDVAEAIHHAHQRQVLHRDLKPANILLDGAGRPHVADFGLAKRIDEEGGISASGAILGSPSYMSPEQAAGLPGGATTACDVYGLGAILYALLTGGPPFRGHSLPEIVRLVREEEPERPSRLNKRVGVGLESICLKCLMKEPRRRYASAAALAEDLGRWSRGEPIEARPCGIPERAWRWFRRRPAIAVSVAAVAGLLVMAAAGIAIFAAREHGLRLEAERTRDELRFARSEEESLRRSVAIHRDNLARDPKSVHVRETLAGVHEQYGDLLSRHGRPADAQAEYREVLTLFSGNAAGLLGFAKRRAGSLSPAASRPGQPAISEESRAQATRLSLDAIGQALLAGWSEVGDLAVDPAFDPIRSHPDFVPLLRSLREWRDVQRPSGLVRELAGHGRDFVEGVAASPDGRHIASCGDDRTVRIWDAGSGVEEAVLEHDAPVCSVAYSPDGRRIASGDTAGTVRIWDVAARKERIKLEGLPKKVYGIAFSPDGRTVMAACHDHMIRLWDAETGRFLRRLEGHSAPVMKVAFSPDGRRALSCGEDHSVRLWDPESGRQLLRLGEHEGTVYCVAFSPDGSLALSGGEDGMLVLWDLERASKVRTLVGHWSWVRSVAFLPDGRAISGGQDGSLIHWDVRAGRILHREAKTAAHTGIAILPGGLRAATSDDDATVRLWAISREGAEARDLALLGRWDLEAYTEAIRVDRGDFNLFYDRAAIFARSGRWAEAAADARVLVDREPSGCFYRYIQAAALAAAGDRAGYRTARGDALLESGDHDGTDWMARLCCLVSGSVEDPVETVRKAEAVAQSSPTGWNFYILGLAEYRCGRYAESIAHLEQSVDDQEWVAVELNWPVLAMAYHRLGNVEVGRPWLARSLERSRDRAQGPNHLETWLHPIPWWDRADFEALTREAEALIGGVGSK